MIDLRRLLCDERGQSLLEISVAAPFFILALVGTFEFGRYEYAKIEMGNAARAAVQYGAQSSTTANDSNGMIASAVADAQELSLQTSDVQTTLYRACDASPTPTTPAPTACPNDRLDSFVQVQITHAYIPLFAYPGLPNPVTMVAKEAQEVSP